MLIRFSVENFLSIKERQTLDMSAVSSCKERNEENTFHNNSNYDSTLTSWASQTLKPSLSFNAGTSKYSLTGQTARGIITGTYLWSINDGGLL